MRNFKKVLSLVLCMAVMLSVMVVGAGAAFKDQSKIKNTEAVDMCAALNIINGYTDGSFKPEGTITRAEACKMICVALNGGKEPATATKANPTYTDIKGHWAEGYIEYCNTKGIVAGIGGGKFSPAGNVTGSQFAKMLLIALGYNANVEGYTGASWELKVNVQANQDGLYKDLEKIDPSVALTRDNAAQMVWNALQAYVIDKSSSIDRTDGSVTDIYTKSTTVDLLEKMYKGETQEGTLVSFTYNTNDKDWDYTVAFMSNNKSDDITVNSDVDYTALLGQKVKAVYDNSGKAAVKDAYGIFAVDSQVVLSGVIGDLPSIAANSTATSFKIDGTTYKTDAAINDTKVYVFTENMDAFKISGNAAMLDDVASVTNYDSQKFEAIDKDGDGKIDFFMIYPVAVAKVSSVSSSTVKLTEKKDPMSVLTDTSVDVDDATIYTGIAKGDYVAYTAAANTADATEVLVKADLVSGKITKLSGSDATINGTVYTFDTTYGQVPGVGTVMTDAVVVNGYIFSADATASADATDYVVVVSNPEPEFGTWRVKLLFSDNTKKVVDLDEQQTLTIGGLYTYETNSDDEYTLTQVTGSNTPSGSVSKKSNSSSKVAYINGNTVLDDSVIFVKYGTDSYKAITGATLKTMSVSQFDTNCVYYVNASSNSSTGVGDVNFAYIATKSSVTSISSNDEFYGYITDISETKNADNKTVKEFTMWTENGETVLKTKANLTVSNTVKENTVVIYKLNSDGDIDSITTTGVQTGAVTAITESFMTIGGDNKYFDDDVIVVTIETDEVEGVAKDCNYSDIGTADKDTNGSYINNVYYVIDDDNEVVFVAYDVDNAIK